MLTGCRSLKLFDSIKSKPDMEESKNRALNIENAREKIRALNQEGKSAKLRALKEESKPDIKKEKGEEGTVR